MSNENVSAHKELVRGRPKTFKRDHVLQTAMMRFWADGVNSVSVGDICAEAGVSKPSLYREFGNEDGLKLATLEFYREIVLSQFFENLTRETSFEEGSKSLISNLLADRDVAGLPMGCLHTDMCQSSSQLGSLASEKAKSCQLEILEHTEGWLRACQDRREIRRDVKVSTAALYVNSQMSAAMNLQKQGHKNEVVESCIRLALASLLNQA